MHCARPRDYHSLGLIRIQFHPPKVTPLTNPAKVTDQGLCYCNSDARAWHNSHQSGVIKVFYGQEPPSGESTTTECGVNYQLLAVIT